MAVFLACKDTPKTDKTVSFADTSLTTTFDQLLGSSNPFEFYKGVFENFRFELKSTLIQTDEAENAPPVESLTTYESNDQEESRFYKKSMSPISEVEWLEKGNRDYIRYDDSKNFLRTSYNPEFEKWKRGIFKDIQLVFNLEELDKSKSKSENQWSCFEAERQKLCIDSKTGLPVFGKAIKNLKPELAVSMVFSMVYGEDAVPATPAPKEKAPSKKKAKKEALRK